MSTDGVKKGALIALPLAATLLSATGADAQWRVVQPQRQQNQQSMRYAEMDQNGDGVITRAEWRGTRQAFNQADTNRDGILSGTEVWIDSGNQGVGNQAVGTAGSRERRDRFIALDENNDGIINRSEWDGSRTQFNWFDTNRDGVITRREYVNAEVASQVTDEDARPTTAGPQVIFVDGRQRWTDTGIYVNAGDIIMLNAQGSVQMSDNGNDIAAPAGANSGRLAAQSPLPQTLAGALIGRIGNSAPFGVGNQRQITAPATGQLFLGVNDDFLDDNRGGYRVRVNAR